MTYHYDGIDIWLFCIMLFTANDCQCFRQWTKHQISVVAYFSISICMGIECHQSNYLCRQQQELQVKIKISNIIIVLKRFFVCRTAYVQLFASLKFWGEPFSNTQTKSINQSKNSNNISVAMRSMPAYQGVHQNNINKFCEPNSA